MGKNRKDCLSFEGQRTGIASYRGTIDGEYALFGRPNIVKSYWECVLDPKRVKKGGKHIVEFTVTDYCGNETVSRESFIW